MAHTTTPVAGGTTGTLADAAPAIDRISGADFQRVKLADATEGSSSTIGVDANPLRVRPRRRGTSDYDSGRVAVAATLTTITASTIYPEALLITNVTDTQRWFTLTNGADAEYLSQYPVAPRNTVVLPLSPIELVGVRMRAEVASALIAQIAGGQ